MGDLHTTLLQHWNTALEKLVLESLGAADGDTRFQLHFFLLGGTVEASALSIGGRALVVPVEPKTCAEEVQEQSAAEGECDGADQDGTE